MAAATKAPPAPTNSLKAAIAALREWKPIELAVMSKDGGSVMVIPVKVSMILATVFFVGLIPYRLYHGGWKTIDDGFTGSITAGPERTSDSGPLTPSDMGQTVSASVITTPSSDVGCDDHVITSTESLIRPSQRIVDRPQGFKFKTNGHTVLISVVRNGVKQPGVRVGPGQSFKSQGGGFQDSDKSGFYITLVDETSATVSFCPKQ